MAEQCTQSIDESSLSYIAAFELDNDSDIILGSINQQHSISPYDDTTPLISLNNSTSDLNLATATIKLSSDKNVNTNTATTKFITLCDGNIVVTVQDDDDENEEDERILKECEQLQHQQNLSEKVDIYLETPVIDEKNIIVPTTSTTTSIINLMVNPKRISDEFYSADNEEEENKNVGLILINKNSIDESLLFNIEDDDEISPSNFLKKIDINESRSISNDLVNNNLVEVDQNQVVEEDDEEIAYDENDVQSMDAIERRDYEQEQKLTARLIRGNSIINNNIHSNENRLNLGLINNNNQNGDEIDEDDNKILARQNTITSTPTSSRTTTIRTTKSTVKLNLSDKIAANDTNIESDIKQLANKKLDVNINNPSKLNYGESSSSTSSSSSSSSYNQTKSIKSESYLNSNSNDSLTSTTSGDGTVKTEDLAKITEIDEKCQDSIKLVTKSSSSTSSDSSATTSRNNAIDNDVEIIDNNDNENSSKQFKLRPSKIQNVDNLLENVEAPTNRFDFPSSSSSSLLARRSASKLNNIANNDQQHNNEHNLESVQMVISVENDNEFDEDNWADCEEGSDIEEPCTCKHYSDEESEDELPSRDVDLSDFSNIVDSTLPEDLLQDSNGKETTPRVYRKRKLTGTLGNDTTPGGRKRLALQNSLSPRNCTPTTPTMSSPLTSCMRRTPRSMIPSKDHPPPELCDWLLQFQKWSHAERILAVDRLIDRCEPTQVRHMMEVIEPQFQRDFISLLPKELALQVLTYLEPEDLLRAAQTCRSWRFLCDDNLLWKDKCKQVNIVMEPSTDRPKRGRAGNMPNISSQWKAAYMRQHIIESNWRLRAIRDPKVLKGHDDHVITCLQFCGNRIVSGSDDNTLKVWSAVSGKCLRTLIGHTGGVWSSQMSGNIIISGSTDRTLKVWNAETGHCVHTLYGHTSTVRCMHLHENKVVSGSRDATLRVWDITTGSCLHVLVGHLAAVRCVQYDGRLVVSGAYDYMVKVWNPERQECLHTLQGHTNRVYSLQFDGIHVVSGSLDTSIRVWDAETGSCKHTLMGHQSLTSGMELRSNILVSGNADSTVKVWDIITGQCLQTLSGSNKHQSAVTCLQFNSRFVITSSDDGTVKLWDVKTGDFIRNLVALDSGGSGGVVWRIRANDTKLVCAVGSRNGTEETKLMVLDFDVEGACILHS